jgi:ubiquinone/menaquinone biosynthesis C-methylase UbiE
MAVVPSLLNEVPCSQGGVDFSPFMLAQAQDRALKFGRTVELVEGDAQALAFPDGSFDTLVCPVSLCSVPDDRQAIAEMRRVLRPGGRLLLADHVASSAWWARAVQRLLELVTIAVGAEHFLRRPAEYLPAAGFAIDRQERLKLGIVERLAARKPATSVA